MLSWRDIEMLLYPELKAIAPHHRERALRQAKEEPIDLIEQGGFLVGIVFAVGITRYSIALGTLENRVAP